jgi:hypothetical protein
MDARVPDGFVRGRHRRLRVTEVIIIVVVLLFGGLAYYLFGDPDRSERLTQIIGPKTPLFLVIVSLIRAIQSVYERRLAFSGLFLLTAVVWTYFYIKQRAASKLASGVGLDGAKTDPSQQPPTSAR